MMRKIGSNNMRQFSVNKLFGLNPTLYYSL